MMRFTVIGKDLMSDHLHALPEGTILEGYQILSVLGVGGFGITYLAQDTDELGKYFAIKEYLPNECAIRTENSTVLPKSSSDKEDYEWGLERFLDEAKTLATFDHPNLNTVFRFFHANGTAYMVLEYIKGETLSAKLKRDKTLDEASLVSLLKALTSGLDVVHKAGYVHRDIKPGNIMIKPDGTPILLDFGAARAAIGQRSKSITAILTPGYAPVEQYDITADDIGPWTDIYAMGMVAYKCITGCSDSELMDAVARSRLHRKNQIDQDLKPASEVGKNRYQADLLVSIDWAIKVNEEDRPQNVTVWVQSLLTGKNAERPSYQSTAPTSNQQTSQTRFKAGSATVATNNTSGTLKWLVMFVGVGVIAVAGYFISQYQSELAKGQSILYVNTQPQGAEIYLDSFYLGKTPYNKDDLPAGQFTLKLTHPDYIAKTDSITLANNEIIKKRYSLQAASGSFSVISEPEGASIYIDGVSTGQKTPATLKKITAGKHKISLKKDRYYPVDANVTITKNKTVKESYQLKGGNLVLVDGEWLEPEVAEAARVAKAARAAEATRRAEAARVAEIARRAEASRAAEAARRAEAARATETSRRAKAARAAEAARRAEAARAAEIARRAKAVREKQKPISPNIITSQGDHSNIRIKAPDIAENGAVVPVSFAGLGLSRNESMTIEDSFGCKLVKVINRSNSVLNDFSTRIKLTQTSDVRVKFNGSDNIYARKNVKVTIGAQRSCELMSGVNDVNFNSGSSSGRRSIRVRARMKGQSMIVKSLFVHPMSSNKFITDFAIGDNSNGYVHVKASDGMSKNPYISTTMSGFSKGDTLKIYYVDSQNGGSSNSSVIR